MNRSSGGIRLADCLNGRTSPRARTGAGKGGENRQELRLADGGLDDLTVRADSTANADDLTRCLACGNYLGKGELIWSKGAGTAEMNL
ncbi:MAG: hypothetical protein Q8O57_08775 [Kiritimatiellota bacterium]|nr:hypothetical protein [Kiritimatiellota bacterium]